MTSRDDAAAAPNRFARTEGRTWGYDPKAVDAFFDRVEATLQGQPSGETPDDAVRAQDVRDVAFGRAHGGYDPSEVDPALDRAEDDLVEREGQQFLRQHGREAWEERITELTDLVFGRLERPDGERFRTPAGASTRGYARADVDALCHEIVADLSRHETVDPDRIRTAVFGPAVGAESYEEQQVDAFLDRTVELLLTLR
ncbi:DivIVA domain-containing protein [Kocuria sp. JC486]|uniref:DivIVA domain-containing protein n=1 Tax=Kocuria sp. JC486 TaxID=1970736 RepID=UPI0014232664|nr:DivIVA domain-containing protein [Kocuria sp. JC486]NHU85123.1 DivIVA domain-containing protein [Kocuria sp. JC486]